MSPRWYYAGIPSGLKLIYRTGKNKWLSPRGLEAYRRLKEVCEVFDRPITKVWQDDLAWKITLYASRELSLVLVQPYQIIDFRESIYMRNTGSPLLKSVHNLDPLVDVVSLLTPARPPHLLSGDI
ncbi:hypothetical protein EV368DRAFT_89895 [Lentinula lateritia]|nr:hypothetical protein EV368DRAFT_89895 [Lentinula lateritia]